MNVAPYAPGRAGDNICRLASKRKITRISIKAFDIDKAGSISSERNVSLDLLYDEIFDLDISSDDDLSRLLNDDLLDRPGGSNIATD